MSTHEPVTLEYMFSNSACNSFNYSATPANTVKASQCFDPTTVLSLTCHPQVEDGGNLVDKLEAAEARATASEAEASSLRVR